MNTAVAIIFAVIAYIGSVVLALTIGAGLMYAHFKGVDIEELEDREDFEMTWDTDDETEQEEETDDGEAEE